MRYAALLGWLAIVLLLVAACGDVEPTPTATQKSPGAGSQTQQIPTPTATPSPKLPGSITPVPASERYRLDLGVGVVVAFVEGLSPKFSGKIAYVTHVPTGSQLVLDPDGEIIDRHDGRDDGPDRLDAVLADQATVDRTVEGLKGDGDLRPRQTAADWAHSIQFGGITYLAKGSLGGPIITEGERALTTEDLGSELYRVAFRIEGYSGYPHLDGDATYLNPGTPVYGVEGYVQEFRLAILEDGGVRLFESDTNPLAKTGEALLDIRGKVTPNAGAAYVFTKPATGGWANELTEDHRTESARPTAPDGAAKDEFGISVVIYVDTVVVGAHQPTYQENNKDVDVGPGAAYVFTRDSNSGKWGQPVKLTASNGVLGDGFGISVAVHGNTAVVGAYLDDRDAAVTSSGSAYVFARKSGVWSQTHNLAAPDSAPNDWFGHSVAVDDGTLLAGLPQDDGRRGSAYAINISNAKWVDFFSTELTMSDDDRYYVYRVRNLTNDQQYAFRVRSVNDAAKPPSAETVAATPRSAKPGKTEGLSAQPGYSRVTLSWDDPRDSSLTGYQVLQPTEQTKLTAGSDGEANGEFGESVAVDDGTAVVGAPEHDINGNANAGAAYVFTRDPLTGVWSDPIELTAGSGGAANDWFGYSVAVDGDGDTIVVGAYQHYLTDDENNILADAGAAYVFTRDPLTGVWSEPVKLIAAGGAANDRFGYSVAVGGDTVVVGTQGHNGKTGAAYVFTWDTNDGWSQTAKLAASGGAGFDYFGHSVAVHRETVVIGARGHSLTPGAAYVFTWDSENRVWGEDPGSGETHRIETAKLTASDANNGDQFGQSVAVDGATVVVGAQQGDNTRGSAYVFTKPTDNDWADNTETARLAASDRGASDSFGASVAIRGGTIVVGAYAANIDVCDADESDNCDNDPRSGAAYLFTKPANVDWVNDPNKDYRTESTSLAYPPTKKKRTTSSETPSPWTARASWSGRPRTTWKPTSMTSVRSTCRTSHSGAFWQAEQRPRPPPWEA